MAQKGPTPNRGGSQGGGRTTNGRRALTGSGAKRGQQVRPNARIPSASTSPPKPPPSSK
jgi:hypothetical protein